MQFRIGAKERAYLAQQKGIPSGAQEALQSASAESNVVEMTQEQASDLRDRCGELLQAKGFGADYEPNDEGRMLEDLIDRLYVR